MYTGRFLDLAVAGGVPSIWPITSMYIFKQPWGDDVTYACHYPASRASLVSSRGEGTVAQVLGRDKPVLFLSDRFCARLCLNARAVTNTWAHIIKHMQMHLRGESFLRRVFSVKSVQNLRTFWRTTQNFLTLGLLCSLYSKQILELRNISKDKKIIIMKVGMLQKCWIRH